MAPETITEQITSKTAEPLVIDQITLVPAPEPQDYAAIPAINWSSLKHLHESPRLYRHRQEHPQPQSQAMLLGTAFHCAALEPHLFESRYTVLQGTVPDGWQAIWQAHQAGQLDDAFAVFGGKVRRGTAWDAFRLHHGDDPRPILTQTEFDRVINIGEAVGSRSILTPHQYEQAMGMGAAVRAHGPAMEALAGARFEHTLRWTDPVTGLACKGRLDALGAGVVDLKKTAASLTEFGRTASRYLYHGQVAFYHDGAVLSAALTDPPRFPVIVAVTRRGAGVGATGAAALDAGVWRRGGVLMSAIMDIPAVLYLDTETTGVDVATCEIVQLGMVLAPGKPRFGGIMDRCTRTYRPEQPIPPEASAVHEITTDDVACCPRVGIDDRPESDVGEMLFRGAILAGHNIAAFDLPILRRQMPTLFDSEAARALPVLDTDRLARQVWPVLPSYKLQVLRYRFALLAPLGSAHQADYDAAICHRLVEHIINAPDLLQVTPDGDQDCVRPALRLQDAGDDPPLAAPLVPNGFGPTLLHALADLSMQPIPVKHIRFGKHGPGGTDARPEHKATGTPVEDLPADYVRWLLKQDWLAREQPDLLWTLQQLQQSQQNRRTR
jgi:exodeoxyribonuclease VIII